jgi:hypothetical protein
MVEQSGHGGRKLSFACRPWLFIAIAALLAFFGATAAAHFYVAQSLSQQGPVASISVIGADIRLSAAGIYWIVSVAAQALGSVTPFEIQRAHRQRNIKVIPILIAIEALCMLLNFECSHRFVHSITQAATARTAKSSETTLGVLIAAQRVDSEERSSGANLASARNSEKLRSNRTIKLAEAEVGARTALAAVSENALLGATNLSIRAPIAGFDWIFAALVTLVLAWGPLCFYEPVGRATIGIE